MILLFGRIKTRFLDNFTSKKLAFSSDLAKRYAIWLCMEWRIVRNPMDQQKEARPVQRRARGLQRMASILDAAETVFAHMGYEEATTNHIAAQAEISPGSLYQFFSNKEEIAQALATRYTEELQRAYDSIFSVEAASLPFSLWLDQILDTLLAFHFAHPAFHILLNTPVSSHVTSLTHALPQELQARFELGFERRAPTLSPTRRRLSATMSVLLFKAVLLQILQAEEDERRLLVDELKTVLRCYLEPLLG
jgi:AcrR family transcriptional regulator